MEGGQDAAVRGGDGREGLPDLFHRAGPVGGVCPAGDVRQGVAAGVQPEMRADRPGDGLGFDLAAAAAAVAAVLAVPALDVCQLVG